MKNVILACCIILFFTVPGLSAEEIDPALLDGLVKQDWFTSGFPNGKWVMDGVYDDDEESRIYYMAGVLDHIEYAQPDLVERIYRGRDRGDMVKAVKEYFRDNPEKRERSVIEVILSGCK